MKTYKTHAELLKLDGKTVQFDYEGRTYKGKIGNYGNKQIVKIVSDETPFTDVVVSYIEDLYEDGNGSVTNIRLYKKTLDDLEQGDIVMDVDGERKKVLGVCGELYFLSAAGAYEVFSYAQTIRKLKDTGYTLVTTDDQEEKEENVLELTLQDIADKFEVDVKTIKIKEVER